MTLRSSTNAQAYSHRFMNSYIMKYNTDKEGRKVANFEFKSNSGEVEIITREGADPNEKRNGVKIWQNSKKNKDSLK